MDDTQKATGSSAEAEVSPNRCQRWLPRRYVLAILCNLAFLFRGLVVVNIGMLVINHLSWLYEQNDGPTNSPSIANITTEEMQRIAYTYYWVIAVGQIPSAILAFTCSPQKIMAITMIISFILQMITPWTLTKSITGVVINVFFQGLCVCPLDCACIGLLRRWAPSTERTRLLMLSFSGRYAHFQIAYWFSFYLSTSIGLSSTYYFAGIVGAVWCILWCSLITDSPPEDQLCSEAEIESLEENATCKLKAVPLKSIVMSLPVICLCLVFVGPALSYKSLMTYFFFHKIDDVESLGQWLLVINCICFIPAAGFMVDRLISGKKFKTTTIRKVLCSGGLTLHVLFVMLFMIQHDITSPLCFHVAFLIMDLVAAGIVPNVLDISSRYSVLVMGLAMTGVSVGSLLFDYIEPLIISKQVRRDSILAQVPMGLIALIAALLFVIFGSAEEQTWSSETLPTHELQGEIDKNIKNEGEEETSTTKNL